MCRLITWFMGKINEKGDSMKAKEYLQQVKKIDKLIENKLIEKEQWFAIATGTTASSDDGDRVQSSGSQQKMADAVCKMVEIQEEINNLIDMYIDTKQGVIKTIEQLPADEYDVLHKIYIQDMNMNDVADVKNKSREWVRQTHGRGISTVQRFLGKKKKNNSKLA